MFKIYKKYRHIFSVLKENKAQTFFCLSAGLVVNILAVLFELATFTLILLAFASLGGGIELAQQSFPLYSYFPFLSCPISWEPIQQFIFYILFAISAQVFRSFMGIASLYLSTKLTIQATYLLEKAIYQQIFSFSFPFVSKYKTGDLVEYIKIPSHTLQTFASALNHISLSGSINIASILMLLHINAKLTLVMFIFFAGFYYGQRLFFRRFEKLSNDFVSCVTESSKEGVQAIHAMRPIHSYNRRTWVLEKIYTFLKKGAKYNRYLSYNHAYVRAFSEIGSISLVGICFVAGTQILKLEEGILLPTLLTYLGIVHRLGMRFEVITTNLTQILSCTGYFQRMENILAKSDKEYDHEGSIDLQSFSKAIHFQNVSLQYSEQPGKAVSDFSLVIHKGSMVALVGYSGAGKSSIIDLLLSLYKPTSGKITVDGLNLQDLQMESWRGKVGVVSQDTFVFNESIEENIRFGLNSVSFEQVKEVSILTGVDHFVQKLPNGYQTKVGERGYRLSGGERQRIAIARALLKNPEIIIFDEATSNLDSYSEQVILKALESFHGKKTIIAIAHRLSTIIDADQIVVMNQGKIVEVGNHKELLEQQGKYAKLWSIQAKQPREKKASKKSLLTLNS